MLNRNNNGYSLIELLIAIQICMIIVTLIYAIYMTGYRYISKWNRNNNLVRAEVMIHKAFINKLHQAKILLEIGDNRIVLINRWYRVQTIHWKNYQIYIDSTKVIPIDIRAKVKKLVLLKKDRIGGTEMKQNRRKHRPPFKSRVVLEA